VATLGKMDDRLHYLTRSRSGHFAPGNRRAKDCCAELGDTEEAQMLEREVLCESRILIVDDHAANIALLERVLLQGGYKNISKTTDPRQVLELFTLYNPDIVLMDLMMPHVDGLSLMQQLRSRIPDGEYLPILVLTADGTATAKRNALTLGAKDFLAKPFDVNEVILRVNNLVETRYLYTQLQQRLSIIEKLSAVTQSGAAEACSEPRNLLSVAAGIEA
jgi:PleD family two-component response regulator